jgi:hypothetical protein
MSHPQTIIINGIKYKSLRQALYDNLDLIRTLNLTVVEEIPKHLSKNTQDHYLPYNGGYVNIGISKERLIKLLNENNIPYKF